MGYDLVTTYTGKKTRTKKKVNITFESNMSSNGAEPVACPMTSNQHYGNDS
jgi:hypothetical protein